MLSWNLMYEEEVSILIPRFLYVTKTCRFKSRPRDLARDSGQTQLTSSRPNPCASSRACVQLHNAPVELNVYLSG